MKKTLILLSILAGLILIYFLFVHESGSGSLDKSETAFSIENADAVQKIELLKVIRDQRREPLVLEKKSDGVWMVNGVYVAIEKKISNLLEVMANLAVKQNLPQSGKENALAMLKTNHTLVSVYDEEGLIKEYFIGAQNPQQTGNIMMIKGKDSPYIVSREGVQDQYVSIYYSVDVVNWRENLLFNVYHEDLSSLEIQFREISESFMFSRQNPESPWQLGEGEPFNRENLDTYLNAFNGKVMAESFANARFPEMLDSLKQISPDFLLSYETFAGFNGKIRIFERPENPNSYFGWVDERNELLTLQKFVLDKFLMAKRFFLEPES